MFFNLMFQCQEITTSILGFIPIHPFFEHPYPAWGHRDWDDRPSSAHQSAASHSSTKVQVGSVADVNPLSSPLLVILPSFVIALWRGVDR